MATVFKAKALTGFNPNGVVIWEGESLLDRAPIFVVATGLEQKSQNSKTGALVQTWILRHDISPIDAVKTGQDASICGDCIHRGDGTGRGRSCYVNVGQAPLNVWRTTHRNRYERKPALGLGDGRKVRIGSYGDPAAVPITVWNDLLAGCDRVQTGYTHQWRKAPELASFCMASVDNASEQVQAEMLGFRTFRVTQSEEDRLPNEIMCPASEEAGRRTTCADCGLCAGNKPKAKSIMIVAHGGSAAKANAQRNLQERVNA